MVEESSPKEVIRNNLLSLKKPVVFHGMIKDWEVLKWSLKDWHTIFLDKELPFRSSVKLCSLKPTWEAKCQQERMTIRKFEEQLKILSLSQEENKWFYFDYKHINEWTQASSVDALESVTWANFGFPEVDAKDSTIWIGSKGSHTPCHFDTYGCNLIGQVMGTKQWILFPQEETKNLKPTRIPYEESSVYSQWNFNSPLPPDFYSGLKDVFFIDLKPGDVLYVPRHWWHYVESLDTTVSINTWLPTSFDNNSQIDEALVRFIVSEVTKNLSSEEKAVILNPNEKDIDQATTCENLKLIKACIQNISKSQENSEEVSEPPCKKQRSEVSTSWNFSHTKGLVNAEYLPCCTPQMLKALLDEKCNCPSEESHNILVKREKYLLSSSKISEEANCSRVNVDYLNKVLNALCHPEAILKIREKLLEECTSDVEGS